MISLTCLCWNPQLVKVGISVSSWPIVGGRAGDGERLGPLLSISKKL